MNQVTLSGNRFTIICGVIVVLLLLVIFLYFRPQASGTMISEEFLNDLKNGRGAAVIGNDATVTFYDVRGDPVPSCGKSEKDIPVECKDEARLSVFNKLNRISIHVFGAGPESTVLIAADDTTYTALPPPICPNGKLPRRSRPYC